MFEQSILTSGKKGKRLWSTCMGASAEAILVGAAVVTPMVWPQALPRAKNWVALYTPTAPPAPRHGDSGPKATRVVPAHSAPQTHRMMIPTRFPPKPVIFTDPPPVELAGIGVPGGVPSGSEHGIPGGLVSDLLESGRPAPQFRPPEPRPSAAVPRETAPAPPRRISISSMQPGKLLSYVKPAYPPLARQARVSGTVELEAVIGTDGRLKELRVKSGNPLLVPAAIDAVRQWVYQPTVLNGEPVEVLTTVLVNFILGQ